MNTLRRNPSTTITAIFAALAALTPFIADLNDSTTPLGVDPVVWGYAAAGLAVAGVLGKMWQAIFPFVTSVTWRWPSIAGFLIGAATALTPYIADLSDAAAPFGIPPSFYVIAGAAIITASHFGRVLQAVAPAFGLVNPPQVVETVPETGGADEPDPPGTLPPAGSDVFPA